MKRLRPSYEMIGDREASLDSIFDEIPSFHISAELEKAKKTTLALATFSIFIFSFNISSPLTISTGVASISIGNLKLFFALLFIYQVYVMKCLIDEFTLLAENNTGSLKQHYYFYLLCRRAAIKFKEHGLVTPNADLEFEMHGIEVDNKTLHAPAISLELKPDQLKLWRSKLSPEFNFKQHVQNNTWLIYLAEATVSQEDLNYWHKNKKRLYCKRKPVHNHYYIPLLYSLVGLFTTTIMLFPSFREWLASVILFF